VPQAGGHEPAASPPTNHGVQPVLVPPLRLPE